MRPSTYDPKKVIFSVGGMLLQGWVDGEFVTAEKAGDDWTMKSGADGQVCRVKQNRPEGTITFKVMASSYVNDLLQGIVNADLLTGLAMVPIFGRDLFGRTVVMASQAWCRKQPNYSAGRDVGEVEWVFDCADLSINLGGNI